MRAVNSYLPRRIGETETQHGSKGSLRLRSDLSGNRSRPDRSCATFSDQDRRGAEIA